MGGGEALALASSPEHEDVVAKVRGWLVEAPFLGFAAGEEPSKIKIVLGRAVGKIFPRFTMMHRIAPEKLAHDPAVQKSLAEDKLCHDTGTLEGLSGLLDRTLDLSSGKYNLLPVVKSVWLAHGTKDQTSAFESSQHWFDAQKAHVEDATFKVYDGCAHQLHADPCKFDFFKDVTDWITERAATSEPAEAEAEAPAAAAPAEPAAEHEQALEPASAPEGAEAAKPDSKL